ncbi:MAG: hypothetical protein ACLU3I_09160 [Acutalibacteraceae bacterium]
MVQRRTSPTRSPTSATTPPRTATSRSATPSRISRNEFPGWDLEEDGKEFNISWKFCFDEPVADEEGNYYNALTTLGLTEDEVTVTTNYEDDVLVIGPGQTAEVVIDVQLTDDFMADIDAIYPNGAYIEG